MTDDVRAFLDSVIPAIQRLTTEVDRAYWDVSTTGSTEAQENFADLQSQLRQLFSDKAAFLKVKELLTQSETDPLCRRQLEILHSEYLPNQIPAETIRDIVRRESAVEAQFTNFRAQLGGKKVSNNEISAILRDSDDQELRREAWLASKQIGAEVATKVVELVEIRNETAKSLGYPDYYALSLAASELDETDLFRTLGELKALTDEPFRLAKGVLDERLARRFGISTGELRPWHYGDPFFQEAPKSEVDLDRYFKDKDLVELVRRYFIGLGLDVDDIIARSDLYERESKDQHAFCTDIDRQGDVRVLANLRPNAKWADTLLHELGHAVYSKYHDPSLPYLLRMHAHLLTTEAVAMLLGRLAKDARWLKRYAGLDDKDAASVGSAASAELRLNELVFVRWGLVVVLFERELYRNPRQDLNRLWREKVESLQLLTYPGERVAPDWAAKIHLAVAPVYYQNYVLGTLAASQFGWSISAEHGADALIGNPAAGRFLIDRIFRPGARFSWNELIMLATGEPLNARRFAAEFIAE